MKYTEALLKRVEPKMTDHDKAVAYKADREADREMLIRKIKELSEFLQGYDDETKSHLRTICPHEKTKVFPFSFPFRNETKYCVVCSKGLE